MNTFFFFANSGPMSSILAKTGDAVPIPNAIGVPKNTNLPNAGNPIASPLLRRGAPINNGKPNGGGCAPLGTFCDCTCIENFQAQMTPGDPNCLNITLTIKQCCAGYHSSYKMSWIQCDICFDDPACLAPDPHYGPRGAVVVTDSQGRPVGSYNLSPQKNCITGIKIPLDPVGNCKVSGQGNVNYEPLGISFKICNISLACAGRYIRISNWVTEDMFIDHNKRGCWMPQGNDPKFLTPDIFAKITCPQCPELERMPISRANL